MQAVPIVPHDQVIGAPAVAVDELQLGGPLQQLL